MDYIQLTTIIYPIATTTADIIYFLFLINTPYPNVHTTNIPTIVITLRLKSNTRALLNTNNNPIPKYALIIFLNI